MATDPQLYIRYMLAYVRLHSATSPVQWTVNELADAFLVLPPPAVTFEAWSASLTPAGPTEDDIERANRNALAVIKATSDKAIVKVEGA